MVSKFSASAVRHTRSISGAMRCIAFEGAPVERLDADARRQACVANGFRERGRECFGVRRFVAGGRRDLGLDVEADVVGAEALHKLE